MAFKVCEIQVQVSITKPVRKNGLVCVEACHGCHSETCFNTAAPELSGTEPENDADEDRNIFDLFEDFV